MLYVFFQNRNTQTRRTISKRTATPTPHPISSSTWGGSGRAHTAEGGWQWFTLKRHRLVPNSSSLGISVGLVERFHLMQRFPRPTDLGLKQPWPCGRVFSAAVAAEPGAFWKPSGIWTQWTLWTIWTGSWPGTAKCGSSSFMAGKKTPNQPQTVVSTHINPYWLISRQSTLNGCVFRGQFLCTGHRSAKLDACRIKPS